MESTFVGVNGVADLLDTFSYRGIRWQAPQLSCYCTSGSRSRKSSLFRLILYPVHTAHSAIHLSPALVPNTQGAPENVCWVDLPLN